MLRCKLFSSGVISAGCMQAKKPFLPLPTLETAQGALPWQLTFSQRLGRHAIAWEDIHAGQCVLAEAAVCAVPVQASDQHTCHSCLSPLPEGADENLMSQGVLLEKSSRHYKHYCSQTCYAADTAVNITGPVHASIAKVATETKCDPTLLRFVLELDARRQLESSGTSSSATNAAPSQAEHQASGSTSSSTDRDHSDPQIITCTSADVSVLLSPWDRHQKGWRDALTEGEPCSHHTDIEKSAFQQHSPLSRPAWAK